MINCSFQMSIELVWKLTLTRELQEVGFMTEDQVVVGNEVEEPNIQLLCIVALRTDKVKG